MLYLKKLKNTPYEEFRNFWDNNCKNYYNYMNSFRVLKTQDINSVNINSQYSTSDFRSYGKNNQNFSEIYFIFGYIRRSKFCT